VLLCCHDMLLRGIASCYVIYGRAEVAQNPEKEVKGNAVVRILQRTIREKRVAVNNKRLG
jgi:hypothetical protein